MTGTETLVRGPSPLPESATRGQNHTGGVFVVHRPGGSWLTTLRIREHLEPDIDEVVL